MLLLGQIEILTAGWLKTTVIMELMLLHCLAEMLTAGLLAEWMVQSCIENDFELESAADCCLGIDAA